ncbi:unnamed protein product [Periconia digitata]|uniref:MIF4G domain-containing protein n=1 Tax=Periconia digitata TaxID=1303443 RepID=A0A9W4XYS2_9PLEO|nr:unnamed protein product [Periconia digitata]
MSAPISTQNPPIAASTPAAANLSSSGSSANVAAGSAQPTARSSYANATKKISSPPIASSAAPPVAVGGSNAQHGKSSSVSPVNGSSPIKPAVPAMGPTIVNSSSANGDHSRKSSVTISAAGTSGFIPNGGPVASSRAPSNLTFGSLAGSPAPSPAVPQQNLNPQSQNPRINSPAHSPSPIPTPTASGGKPDALPTRPGMPVFGGGSDGTESNNRPISMPPQPHSIPQSQHLRRESSQSAHSDMGNQRFQPGNNSGRGRGNFQPGGYPQMGHSPQPQFRQMNNPPRGPMPPNFQPAMNHPNSPYRQNRSPAISPAVMHQQQMATQSGGMPYYPAQYQQQMNYMPGQLGADPYGQYYGNNYNQAAYGSMGQSMYAPGGIPPSPRNHYQVPYGQAPPQAQGMARTNSNMSESRPQSAVAQPSTPAMTNVNASHTHTPSAASASPAPSSSTFAIPPKKKSNAIVIKTTDGKVVDFKNEKKPASPAPSAGAAPPKSPAIVATPTPPPRPESTHSRAESVAAKTDSEKKADFVLQFKKQLEAEKSQKEADEKKAKDDEAAAAAKKEEEERLAKEEAEKAAKEKSDAEASKKAEEDAAEKKRKEDEEFERMIAEMEAAEKEEQEREAKFAEKKKIADAERKAKEEKEADERLKAAEREAEALEAKRAQGGDEESAKLFASLKKNTQFGPGAAAESDTSTPAPAPEPTSAPVQPKSATKAKPHPLKLETNKAIEPAQPTAGMNSLKSARFLAIKNEVNYPEGVSSPNPALNATGKGGKSGRPYDMSFLLQFQSVFKEKPSVDWDMKLKETVGDPSDSARTPGPRPASMGPRQPSRTNTLGGGMGNFGSGNFPQGRTLPPGTSSEERFRMSQGTGGRSMTNPLGQMMGARAGGSGSFPVQVSRNASYNMGANGPNSPRVGSSRGRGSRRGDKPAHNAKEEKAMPLTAGMQIKDLERSQTGWTPMSLKGGGSAQPASGGHMAPDMVQRKVKAALNKMTPEKFDKIADQILEIAGQSKNEQDGRTLRQVIQLTFEKACDEQHWSSMYAKFCAHMLNTMSTEIKDENVRDKHGNPVVGGALFRKYLLNRCQEEFEKGWEINLPDKPEGQTGEAALLSEEYYVAAAAKRRGLGLIQFIGELYKLNMLTLRIMHECVLKLLDFEGLPDESAVESLTKLLRTVGGTMAAADAGPKMLDVYFQRIEKIMNMEGLNSRLKFMLMDLCDLRRSNWVSKDADKGPMTLTEIHAKAAAQQQAAELERQRNNTRGGPRPHMGRGDARSFSGGGMPPPADFPTGRVQMDDLRKLTRNNSSRNAAPGGSLGPSSLLGGRTGSGRRGLGPGGNLNLTSRGDESGASSRTATPVSKEKEPTNANSFSALMSLGDDVNEVTSPPSTASSPPQGKTALSRSKSPAAEAKPSE